MQLWCGCGKSSAATKFTLSNPVTARFLGNEAVTYFGKVTNYRYGRFTPNQVVTVERVDAEHEQSNLEVIE